jgi:hypothetical protein
MHPVSSESSRVAHGGATLRTMFSSQTACGVPVCDEVIRQGGDQSEGSDSVEGVGAARMGFRLPS